MADLALNRRAYSDYEILQTYEAGIELRGFEVKAVKTGHINLAGSFAVVQAGELRLLNAMIPAHQPKNTPADYDPQRTRRLLLHRKQIQELIGGASSRGLTIIPLKVYTVRNLVKILIGLARHKKGRDKREIIKKRETQREIDRAIKHV